jgi:hypothetical protein
VCRTQENTETAEVQSHRFHTWTEIQNMTEPHSLPAAEELGYFYDTIHGRIAMEDLPEKFCPALKSALSSRTLGRLKRISQLGHTSLSFFSATHTRFSHAVGTMLVMNDLFRHVEQHGLSKEVI